MPRRNFLYTKCQRKIGHATREDAQQHIDSLVRDGMALRATLTIYHCHMCGAKHVGSKNCYLRGAKARPKVIRSGGVLLCGR